MKRILPLIFFLASMVSSGQNMHVNYPELVYPVLEEFVSENFERSTPTFEKLVRLDSIVVKDLGYERNGPFEKKNYGFHHRQGDKEWIEIDISLVNYPEKFEETLKHELGHVFGLQHIDVDHLPQSDKLHLEIMSSPKYLLPYNHVSNTDPELWRRVNDNFYNHLKTLQK
jgi:hypothetical protein